MERVEINKSGQVTGDSFGGIKTNAFTMAEQWQSAQICKIIQMTDGEFEEFLDLVDWKPSREMLKFVEWAKGERGA